MNIFIDDAMLHAAISMYGLCIYFYIVPVQYVMILETILF